jgi:NAD(P)-dependent dehydrogenase (short-subunit alcohol dehydrogenase family)
MSVITSVLITGANIGLGRESARQLALRNEVEKIYLAGRNPEKLHAARDSLEQETGRSIFETVIIDLMDLESVRQAVGTLPAVDAVVLNAGGVGRKPHALTSDGVMQIFATNVLGHVQLVEGLIAANKLLKAAVYVSSEAVRGMPKMRVKRPALKTHSVDELASIADGSFFATDDPMTSMGYVKYLGNLWMSSLARDHQSIRFVTVSPGGTGGTGAVENAPFWMGLFFKYIAMPIMPLFGIMHGLDVGAKRYVDVLTDDAFVTGHFYASPAGESTGPLVDQAGQFADLDDPTIQDNAAMAVRQFLKRTAGAARPVLTT